MAKEHSYIKIIGSVEDVIFKSEETGFCVIDVDIGGELISADDDLDFEDFDDAFDGEDEEF